jgi:site-specific recombinase XerC
MGARWRDPEGKQRKRSFVKRSDADRFLTSVEHSVLIGAYVDPAAGRTTVGEVAETWKATRVHLAPKTVASYESALRSRVLPRWGSVPLDRVKYEDVSAWMADMRAEGLSAARCRYVFAVLRMVLDHAVKAGSPARNPTTGVALPRLPTTERRTCRTSR